MLATEQDYLHGQYALSCTIQKCQRGSSAQLDRSHEQQQGGSALLEMFLKSTQPSSGQMMHSHVSTNHFLPAVLRKDTFLVTCSSCVCAFSYRLVLELGLLIY